MTATEDPPPVGSGSDPADPPCIGCDDDARTPLWRDEFPFTSTGEERVARRDFARYLLAASGVFAAGTAGAAAWAALQRSNTGEPRPIVDLQEVPPGSDYLFRYPTDADPAILVHLERGELRAYSQRCTHLGCVVFWQPDRDRLYCPCHEGVFDPGNGDPTAGPPERPLTRIDVEVRNGVVWARGVDES